MEFDVVIGLEIHAELATKTKIFCSCKNEFGAKPNINTCPVCTGMPGALPLLNKHAVELCIKAGLCFGCDISEYAEMERKNYFYPDLSKAYQISQFVYPICKGGYVRLSNGEKKLLNRIHLEEDAGKLIHISKLEGTLIDYNRGGTPLIEMVTEPVFSGSDEVVEFLKKVRETLVFAGVAECKMEQGGMRCDVNLSLKPKDSKILGTRTEMKNLNSFKSVKRAIEYEIQRQKDILESGGKIMQETRKWDDAAGENFAMRSKEESQDYRYFPDPDVLPIEIRNDDVEQIKKSIPMLPEKRREKYILQGIKEIDAELLTSEKYISDFFDECVSLYDSPKKICNWIITDLFKLASEGQKEFAISAKHFTEIIELVDSGKITKASGLALLEKVIECGGDPKELAVKFNLISDVSEQTIVAILEELKAKNPKLASDLKQDPKIKNYIMGQVMKQTQGKANSELAFKCIDKIFGKE